METETRNEERGGGQDTGASLSREKLLSYLFIIGIVVAIGANMYFRLPMLRFSGFYEPDGYFHYTVVRAAVNNHFAIPQYAALSGFPYFAPRPPHHEPFGLYWTTLLPYLFLQYAGISYYDIMRLMPVLFGILDALAAYFLSRYWSKDKLFGLLVMFFVGLNMGNAARTSALIYRGDSFVTFFLLVALILTVEIFRTENRRRKMYLMLGSAFALSLCNLVWNGAPFTTAIYVFILMMIFIVGYTFEKRKLVSDARYMVGALAIWFAIVNVYIAELFIVSAEAFTGWHFFILFIPAAIGWYVVNHLMNKKREHPSYTNTPQKRFALMITSVAATFLLIYALIPAFVTEIFVTSGFLAAVSFSTTIQELQPPNYNFLFASFGLQNFANPVSIIIMIATYFSNLNVLFWFVLLALFTPYLFMHVDEDDEGLVSGRAVVRFAFNETQLILISYFALTAYLQLHAIRFNSLLSIPISMFSAYTIYWFVLLLKRYRYAYYASYLLLALLIVYMVNLDSGYISGLAPADQINVQFLSAMSWMKNNTAPNSVVLTLWPDGSVVESVANRTSITDSVSSQYAYKAQPFARWLYNSSPNPQFLLGNLSGKPDYIVVRNSWLVETGGIFTESGINTTAINNYAYQPFATINERVNQSQQVYQFLNGGLEEDTVVTTTNAGRQISSFLKLGDTTVSPFKYIGFYNVLNGNFSTVLQTGFNKTNNQTFLILFSSVPSPSLFVNITGAYILGTALANSNMIKLMFQCNSQICAWSNNLASAQLVYINQDTKIFRIVYNQSNPAAQAVSYPRPSLS